METNDSASWAVRGRAPIQDQPGPFGALAAAFSFVLLLFAFSAGSFAADLPAPNTPKGAVSPKVNSDLDRFHSALRDESVRPAATLVELGHAAASTSTDAAAGDDVCLACDVCSGGVTKLTFRYDGTVPNAAIVVRAKDGSETYFTGTVQPGGVFTVLASNAGVAKMKNDIVILVGGVQQGDPVHVSCSKPIAPGMTFGGGGFFLLAGSSVDGGAMCPAGGPTACQECAGGVVSLTFRYGGTVVNASIVVRSSDDSETYFSGIVQPGQEFIARASNAGKAKMKTDIEILVSGVQKGASIHTSCSQPIGPGQIVGGGEFEITAGESVDGGAMCPIGCTVCTGGVLSLTFRYDGTVANASIVVRSLDASETYFSGVVQPGQQFTALASNAGKPEMKNDIVILLNGLQQGASIHTSCSKPIGPGMVVGGGNFLITAALSVGGIPMCPIDGADDCMECKGGMTSITFRYDGTVTNASIVVRSLDARETYFSGIVQPGQEFTALASNAGVPKMKIDVVILLGGVQQGRSVHTSCSQPIGPGLVVGDGYFLITAAVSVDNGPVCPIAGAICDDFGDALDTFGTLVVSSGARHGMYPGLPNLGPIIDGELNGFPSIYADGDDNDGTSDDEDGVTFATPLVPGAEAQITVELASAVTGTGLLDAWIDFNGNGVFDHPTEHLFGGLSTTLSSGLSTLSFSVPADAVPTDPNNAADVTYARFRVSTQGGLPPKGTSFDGEIEDYAVKIAPRILPTGAIGNFVWKDENEDGFQDAGEPGLPGISVKLNGTDIDGTPVSLSTTTDAHGGYLFDDLAPGSYAVTIDASTLPDGVHQTTNPVSPGADFGNQTLPYAILLGAGEENLTADFGFIWCSPNTNSGCAALGDRVWIDIDGDGAQDPDEAGLGGVKLTIYGDSNNDGVVEPGVDTPFTAAVDQDGSTGTGTTLTKPDGSYIFHSLPAGQYVVVVNTPPVGYTQTGDPDQFGLPATSADNRTTAPVILEPGDAFLNADFGYRPVGNTPSNRIGDTVFLDLNADGTEDAGEPGIKGVTVALFNQSGDVIATATTDNKGFYLFDGLPDGTFGVKVTDSDHVLGHLVQTADPDGTLDEMGATTLNKNDDLTLDFGYVPKGHDPGEGLIGDTIFLNTDGDGTQDPDEPGIEGVIVVLTLPGGGTVTTTTDENGNYYFGGLDPSNKTYTVTVDAGNFLAGGTLQGLLNTVDPDVTKDGISVTTLTPGNPIDLNQDFGYTPLGGQVGSIGDLVWLDRNAGGVRDPVEVGIEGVTLALYRDLNLDGDVDPGEPLFGTKTTDANGAYLFATLPLGRYVVDVTDADGVLLGYWHSLGTPNLNDNSQEDPYSVTISAGSPNNLTADFGYYIEPGALGNFVWFDSNADGLQDAGEPGIAGIDVRLDILYPDGSTVKIVKKTNVQGEYTFTNLLIDEDFDGVGSAGVNEPKFNISVPTPPAAKSPSNVGANDQIDSDADGVQAFPKQGESDASLANDASPIASYDFGFKEPSLPIGLSSFKAEVSDRTVRLIWETATETVVTGFGVERAFEGDGFEEIGFVEGTGTSSEKNTYTFEIDEMPIGAIRFRLKQIDFDGGFAYSSTIEVAIEMPGEYVLDAVYPNPFNPSATIPFAVKEPQHVRLVLYDTQGRKVQVLFDGPVEGSSTQRVRIDAKELPSGTYLVRLEGENFTAVRSAILLK